MRKFVILTAAILFLSFFGNLGKYPVLADNLDEFDRGDRPVLSRDDRPVLDREDRIINPKFKSKLYPTEPPVGGVEEPTSTPVPSGDNGEEDPCAPGKSFVGPHCGWSPDVDNSDDGNGGGNGGVGGPEVLGLSATSSGDLASSDIILLTGVLCLLLYLKSMVVARKSL